ncbi:hypothetical protein L596_011339 [Steinernema carpocapsae]|uniref:Uncharacterized protein n=1 Tax=Steinernema carpocapsae TaxID=34508 RepID=A0A4V6A4F9_STECR|nr:hypothetical protein L596_011339 [Steinernema carpocapsae]
MLCCSELSKSFEPDLAIPDNFWPEHVNRIFVFFVEKNSWKYLKALLKTSCLGCGRIMFWGYISTRKMQGTLCRQETWDWGQ